MIRILFLCDDGHFPGAHSVINYSVLLKQIIMKKIPWMLLILMLFAGGCTTSRITSSWKADHIRPAAYKKILVLGMINEPDRTLREKMEEHIAAELRQLGYDAVCSCDEFSPKTFENMTEEQALDKLSYGGVDAALTVVLLDKEKERYYVPGRIHYSPYAIYYNRFWGYYRTMYTRVYDPGYYTEDTRYFWETNFYSLAGKELLYSAQSQSFNPSSAQTLGREYGRIIVSDMVKNRVLTSQPAASGLKAM